jgi:hypothetical protein
VNSAAAPPLGLGRWATATAYVVSQRPRRDGPVSTRSEVSRRVDQTRVFEDTYLVALLGPQAKAELRHRLILEAIEHKGAHGPVAFAFPHRILSVRRT